MNNRFFGDAKDLVKYDLVIELMERLNDLDRLTSLLMMTAEQVTQQTPKYPRGLRRKSLYRFLAERIERKERKASKLRDFFGNRFEYIPYRDDADPAFQPYSVATRMDYFAAISPAHLQKALVFIDPDTGIEPVNRSSMKGKEQDYLMWDDLQQVFRASAEMSAFLVYQHLQPDINKHEESIENKARGIIAKLEIPGVVSLSTAECAFFFFSRSPTALWSGNQLLAGYAVSMSMGFRLMTATQAVSAEKVCG